MKRLSIGLLASIPVVAGAVLLASPMSGLAERDQGATRQAAQRYAFKEVYWEGHCKVERRFESGGEYKEERKCREPVQVGRATAAPVQVSAAAVADQPGGAAIRSAVNMR